MAVMSLVHIKGNLLISSDMEVVNMHRRKNRYIPIMLTLMIFLFLTTFLPLSDNIPLKYLILFMLIFLDYITIRSTYILPMKFYENGLSIPDRTLLLILKRKERFASIDSLHKIKITLGDTEKLMMAIQYNNITKKKYYHEPELGIEFFSSMNNLIKKNDSWAKKIKISKSVRTRIYEKSESAHLPL